ncbi:alpha/beta hydrolase [Loigolactobacillus jiayinensis]|uniref:Alpha/beta hydrolase n=1 Tax=Loigolactobacillus jiayinensis TaxID=2486016 RepID=A0ABW1RDL2_9LACO|nr:alpha/beta hydrolase [Loigolactobacillus jiayinensis]
MKIKSFKLNQDKESSATVTAYLLANSAEMLRGKRRPAIIINPGGGYFSCSDREAEPVAMYFASLGYQTFVLRYTTYSQSGLAMPDLSQPLPVNRASLFPRQLLELGQTMLLVKAHVDEWYVDPDKIIVCGFSAGGHNAALYATRWQDDLIAGPLNVEPEQLRPAACIVGYPLTDYNLVQQELENKTNPMDIAFMKASNVALLGEETPNKELLDEVSPTEHISTNTPPMFIWATATDPLGTARQALRLADDLAQHKIDYEVHIFGEGGHGLSLSTQASAGALSDVSDYVAQWTSLCAKWLTERFPIALPKLSAFEQMKLDNGKI